MKNWKLLQEVSVELGIETLRLKKILSCLFMSNVDFAVFHHRIHISEDCYRKILDLRKIVNI